MAGNGKMGMLKKDKNHLEHEALMSQAGFLSLGDKQMSGLDAFKIIIIKKKKKKKFTGWIPFQL